MGMAAGLAASGIGGLMSAFGRSKPKTTTQSYENESTTEALLAPRQKPINRILGRILWGALDQGPEVSQSDRNIARSQINSTYDAMIPRMESNLAARGFGGSGKLGSEMMDLNIARAKGFQTTEATLRREAQDRFQQMIANAFQYLVPRITTTHSKGTQTGTMPGQSLMEGIGGGIGDLGSLLYMRGLGGFGGGGGGMACWVARAVYGENDWRPLLLASWFTGKAKTSRAWRLFWDLYCTYGPVVAPVVRRSGLLRRVVRRWFDPLVNRAIGGR